MNDEHNPDDPAEYDLKIAADEPVRAKSIAPPPDYTSRAIRFRLMVLFGMLLAVIVLMKEAGNPKRWKWMFPDQPVNQQPKDEAQEHVDRTPMFDPKAHFRESDQTSGAASARESSAAGSPSTTEPATASAAATDYPRAAVKFWHTTYAKMSSQQRQDLFHFLKSLRTSEPVSADRKSDFEKLVGVLKQHRKKFHRDLLDELAILSSGTPAKTELANDLFESEQVWDKKVLPALTAALIGEELTIAQSKKIEQLQAVLDPLIFNEVRDHAPIGWEGDTTAWLRMWELVAKTHEQTAGQIAIPATHLQLTSQPNFYRGQTVEIEGWVRQARRRNLVDSELPFLSYYELWLRPADTNVSPYCIYVLKLPADFPEVGDQFRELNERVRVVGRFFKLRTYEDGAQEVRECPLLLASTLQRIGETKTIATKMLDWQPSRATWIGLLIVLSLFAGGLAWLAFRTSATRRYQPGAKTAQQINQTLSALKDDPAVQTDLEKIQELYRE